MLQWRNVAIGDEGVKTIADALLNNKTLLRIDLKNTGIRDKGIESIMKLLDINTTISIIDLSKYLYLFL